MVGSTGHPGQTLLPAFSLAPHFFQAGDPAGAQATELPSPALFSAAPGFPPLSGQQRPYEVLGTVGPLSPFLGLFLSWSPLCPSAFLLCPLSPSLHFGTNFWKTWAHPHCLDFSSPCPFAHMLFISSQLPVLSSCVCLTWRGGHVSNTRQ